MDGELLQSELSYYRRRAKEVNLLEEKPLPKDEVFSLSDFDIN